MKKVTRALISVYDKEGIVEFATGLEALGIEILSTGGTLALLQKHGVKAIAVDGVTQFPEIMDGRVKTLHPKIHGGILAVRDNKKHVAQMKENGIEPIDLVVITLYPFEETIKKKGVTLAEAIEKIDIGGPTMLRAAAKNWQYVASVCDGHDYANVLDELQRGDGVISDESRLQYAQKVFSVTSRYDYAIQSYLSGQTGTKEVFPQTVQLCLEKRMSLRYGENPHQKAALYSDYSKKDDSLFTQYHGKELSYNNILDMYAALDIIREFDKPVACVVKHNNPCGIAEHDDLAKAVVGAVDSDPLSAFGGIVGLNEKCTEAVAKVVFKKLAFFEIIIAPGFTKEALAVLKGRKNLRIIKVAKSLLAGSGKRVDVKYFSGGVLLQEEDAPLRKKDGAIKKSLVIATKKKPSEKDIDELIFAWKCVKVVKSNAIVITKGKKTVGIGAGQMSRVGSMEIACKQAGGKAKGGYVASDAFFPMPDNIEVAAQYGIRSIVQPGGSIRDDQVVQMAEKKGMSMVFTGKRHFRH